MKKTDKYDWQRGYWQADADLQTEGDILAIYPVASESFRAGYRSRLSLEPAKPPVRKGRVCRACIANGGECAAHNLD